MNPIVRYTRWLHTRWPAGTVEKLPAVNDDGSTSVPGVYIVGDLTGIPLLKFSADTGAKAVRTIMADPAFQKLREPPGPSGTTMDDDVIDIAIIGGGVSGFAAAMEAEKEGLSYTVLEASEPFSTIVNFPRAKPIYTYPTDMQQAGDMHFHADVKESLLDELREQTLAQGMQPRQALAESITRQGKYLHVNLENDEPIRARRVIIAIGRSGNYRKLNVPGEERDKVTNRLHDPADYAGQQVLVVGGGDSALEAAVAVARAGGHVALSYRGDEFTRPKPENIEALQAVADGSDPQTADGSLSLHMATVPKEIGASDVTLAPKSGGAPTTLPNDAVLSLIGREPPLDFFRRSGIRITGEWNGRWWALLVAMLVLFTGIYYMKAYTWGPWQIQRVFDHMGSAIAAASQRPTHLLGVIRHFMVDPGFYYAGAYTAIICIFGIRRMRRRKTPYVNVQTWTLMAFQVLPLFLLPYIIFPWMGSNGLFDAGLLRGFADAFMPLNNPDAGLHDLGAREYWRAFGFILAWPLFVWNIFHGDLNWWWLGLSLIQTFVIIPLIVWRWGKGAYCGWVCSCGAMAETLGDTQRQKMPHGPVWNRLNMVGQVILATAFILLAIRILGWAIPGSDAFERVFTPIRDVYWKPVVDITLAGILGFGLYFNLSGRVWCRFACPLAALMHIYARFTRFRIFADKKKCISCNVCTSVCHQGIDVMAFANKGKAMEDPECVRCSACVQSCPTGVLTFGRIDPKTGDVAAYDRLPASPVQMAEKKPTPNG